MLWWISEKTKKTRMDLLMNHIVFQSRNYNVFLCECAVTSGPAREKWEMLLNRGHIGELYYNDLYYTSVLHFKNLFVCV